MTQSLENLLMCLYESSGEKDENVKLTLSNSLQTVGVHQPELVLRSAYSFLTRNTKCSGAQRGFLLTVMNRVVCDSLTEIDEELAALLINLATQEITLSKEVDAEWQSAAGQVLVTLSRRFCSTVMDSLLQKFQPGSTPHPYVLYTLGLIAVNCPFGFVPFLSDVLSRTVPMLTQVKTEVMKVAFAVAMGQYCEGICDYLSNIKESPDPTVTKDVYSASVSVAFDTLFTTWFKTKDYKLRSTVVRCLGEMCHVIPEEKFHEELRKLVPAFTTLYKNSPIPYQVSQGLCALLEAAARDDTCPLDPYLEEILAVIFPQVCEEVSGIDSSGDATKNQNEILRCFKMIAIRFADRLVYYLLQKMQSGQEKHKLGAISTMRFLINASGPYMEDKRCLVMNGLKAVLGSASSSSAGSGELRPKKALCQLAVALADHRYLDAEGGTQVVQFLIRNLVASDNDVVQSKKGGGDTSAGDRSTLSSAAQQLRGQSGQALLTIAKTSPHSQDLLWPYLLEFVCVESYTPALTDLFRCLTILAQRIVDENNVKLTLDSPAGDDNSKNGSDAGRGRVPGASALLARLLAVVGGASVSSSSGDSFDSGGRRRIDAGLQLMSVLAPLFHPCFTLILTGPNGITTLNAKLEELEESTRDPKEAQQIWEKAFLKFVNGVLMAAGENDWRRTLAAVMAKQLSLYAQYSQERQLLCRMMGMVLAKIADEQFVVDHLELMFRAVNHASKIERNGCAQSVGIVASSHCSVVATKLENIAKWEHQRKSGGLFGFIKDSMQRSDADVDMVNLRGTIILSFGHLIYHSPIEVTTSQLESTVMPFLKPYFDAAKDAMVRECVLETIDLIARALLPSRLNADYTFLHRVALLNHCKDYASAESEETMTSLIRLLAAKCTASLAQLNPPLTEGESIPVVSVLAKRVFPLSTVKSNVSDTSEAMAEECVATLHKLFSTLLKRQPNVATLQALIKVVQPWHCCEKETQRIRSFKSSLFLLNCYYEHAADCAVGQATDFSVLGSLLGRYCPRWADTSSEIRFLSVESVYVTLSLAVLHKGVGKDYQDSAVRAVRNYADRVMRDDMQQHLRAVSDVAELLETRLSPREMQLFLSVLYEVVLDVQTGVGCAAATLLSRALTIRGAQLTTEADKIVSTTIGKLSEVKNVQTYTECLQSLNCFARHHTKLTLNTLLAQPLPFATEVVDCWQTLGRDRQLFNQILDHVLDTMALADEFAYESAADDTVRYARVATLSVSEAFLQLVKVGGSGETAESGPFGAELSARLLSAILLHIGCLVDTQFSYTTSSPELRRIHRCPAALAMSALKALLLRTRSDLLFHWLNDRQAWTDFEDPLRYHEAVWELCHAIAHHQPEWVRPLTVIFDRKADSNIDSHRIIGVSALAAFVKLYPSSDIPPHGGEVHRDGALLETLVAAMMKALGDSCITVRMMAVKGMGDISFADDADITKYTTNALSAVMAGLEDPGDHDDQIALQAMQGLSKLSTRISKENLDSILVNVLLRIRPCFEKESGALRTVALTLYGELGKFGECESYREQIHTNLVALLLRLNDQESEVCQASGRCLVAISRLLDSDAFKEIINKHLSKSAVPVSYHVFLKEFCKVLTTTFSDRINFYAVCCSNYYKTPSPRIRANAALLTGYLLGSVPAEWQPKITKDVVFSGLALLLKEPEAQVRQAAAEAVACLHCY